MAEAETTSPDVPEPITEEPIPQGMTEEQAQSQIEELPDVETPKGEAKEKQEKPDEGKPRSGRPYVKVSPEGDSRILHRPDGTTVEFSSDEWEAINNKRIARTRYELGEAERKAAALQADRDRLQAELEQVRQARPEPKAEIEPEPDLDDFDSFAEYKKAFADWNRKQVEAELKQAQEPAKPPEDTPSAQPQLTGEQKAFVGKVLEMNKEGMERFGDDYKAQVIDNPDAPYLTPHLVHYIMESAEDPVGLLMVLGDDHDTGYALAQTLHTALEAGQAPPPKFYRDLLKAESRVTAPGGSPDDSPDGDSQTTTAEAPAPSRKQPVPDITPVSTRGRSTPRKSPESMTQAEYEQWRKQGGG